LKNKYNLESKIAIVGGGLAGISTAYYLLKLGLKNITIFEASGSLKGLVSSHKVYSDLNIENFYHHLFTTDKYILDLIKELNLSKKLKFKKVLTSHLINNKIYNFGSVKDILKTEMLNLSDKFRFLLIILLIKFLPDKIIYSYRDSALSMSKKFFGKKINRLIWEPLLIKKFSNSYSIVPSSWLFARIKCRSPELGYIHGSFDLFSNELLKIVRDLGVQIKLNSPVNKVEYKNSKFLINLVSKPNIKSEYDIAVISAPQNISNKILSNNINYLSKQAYEYLSATCVLIYLDESPFEDYWINYCDHDTKALAVINHNAILDNKKDYLKYPIYVAYYHSNSDELFKKEYNEFLIKDAVDTLKKVCYLRKKNLPRFNKEEIKIFKGLNAQPIIYPFLKDKSYSDKFAYQPIQPSNNIPLFFSNMHCIFPQDRGQNYSIKISKKVSQKIKKFITLI